jgi:DNA-binding NtrC family response regulator
MTRASATAAGTSSGTGAPPSSSETGEFLTLSEVEKRHILAALKRSKGNRTHAAKMLSISIRTLRNKLNEYNFKGSPAPAEAESIVA